ncbi:hypothetical protein BDZ91DRAFT_709071 [Kalaharituber pfeilii]|nr:hypothetical protein BDZ91DRAFT_709071 [Kalaharituber pfeilii]
MIYKRRSKMTKLYPTCSTSNAHSVLSSACRPYPPLLPSLSPSPSLLIRCISLSSQDVHKHGWKGEPISKSR